MDRVNTIMKSKSYLGQSRSPKGKVYDVVRGKSLDSSRDASRPFVSSVVQADLKDLSGQNYITSGR